MHSCVWSFESLYSSATVGSTNPVLPCTPQMQIWDRCGLMNWIWDSWFSQQSLQEAVNFDALSECLIASSSMLTLSHFIIIAEKEQRRELWWRQWGGDPREQTLHRWTRWHRPVHPQGLSHWYAHSQLVPLNFAQSSTEGWRGVVERLPLHPN